MWTPGLLAFSLTLIREITKDIADLEGDQIAKHSTYPIQYGIKGAIKLISVLSFVVFLSALVPYFNNTYNDWYLIILLIGVEIPLEEKGLDQRYLIAAGYVELRLIALDDLETPCGPVG